MRHVTGRKRVRKLSDEIHDDSPPAVAEESPRIGVSPADAEREK